VNRHRADGLDRGLDGRAARRYSRFEGLIEHGGHPAIRRWSAGARVCGGNDLSTLALLAEMRSPRDIRPQEQYHDYLCY